MKAITIYKPNLAKIKVRKNGVQLTKGAEDEIVKLLNAQKMINELIEQVKEVAALTLEEANTSSYEGEKIKITRSITGRRFSLDPAKQVNEKFIQTVSYQQPNSKAIDAYLEREGKIPSGILENARKTKVDLELIDEA